MTYARRKRYSPHTAAEIEPRVLAALDDQWRSTGAICKLLGVWSEDGTVRYCLKRLANDSEIERSRGGYRGITFLYRRKTDG